MANMSRHTSAGTLQGFSVFQSDIGAPLQFLPALGSAELDEMMHAFLPGPASIQDKRTTISMDFFTYAGQTGSTFKFYPVYNAVADSPACSNLQDSAYGSSFNVSPVVSDLGPWTPSQSFTNASPTPSQQSQSRSQSSAARRPSAPRPQTDFSHLPGMRIMTKDGLDVTNSASRGCKTKEQRDHAHLMRIMKACPACKKKKVRCDPSHKRQATATRSVASSFSYPSSASSSSCSPPPQISAKSAAESPPMQVDPASSFIPSDLNWDGIVDDFVFPEELPADFLLAGPVAALDSSWEQFVQYDGDGFAASAANYDFFNQPNGNFSFPNNATILSPTSSPTSSFQPVTPVDSLPPTNLTDLTDVKLPSPAGPVRQEPTLPYLSSTAQGTNYVDFNLYSPVSDFLDEDPRILSAAQTSAGSRWKKQSSPHPSSEVVAASPAVPGQFVAMSSDETDSSGLRRGGAGATAPSLSPAPNYTGAIDHGVSGGAIKALSDPSNLALYLTAIILVSSTVILLHPQLLGRLWPDLSSTFTFIGLSLASMMHEFRSFTRNKGAEGPSPPSKPFHSINNGTATQPRHFASRWQHHGSDLSRRLNQRLRTLAGALTI